MRVTQNMLTNTLLRDISMTYSRISKSQTQLATGSLYQRPSDNPIAAGQGLNLRSVMKSLNQYTSNVGDGLAWLNSADTAFTNAIDVLYRAKELAVQGATGTNNIIDLNEIAKEVDQIISSMLSIANTKHDGRYIFAGNQTLTQPFTYNPEVAGPPLVQAYVRYDGDGGDINFEIEQGVTVSVNVPGTNVFKGAVAPIPPGALPADSIFKILIDLHYHLVAGDYAAVSNDTSLVDVAIQQVTDASITIGAKINRLEVSKDRQEQDKLNLKKSLSDLEDIDITEVLTRLKMEELVYQSALTTGSMTMQKSLIDFLR